MEQLPIFKILPRAPKVTLYRPSNATDGDTFQAKWCAGCALNDEVMTDGEQPNTCEILGASLAYQVDDPDYPQQWRIKNGWPVCTAFERFEV